MYVPPAFAVEDEGWAIDLIARNPFGLLVTTGADGLPRATHLPMLAERRDGGLWIVGHVARANAQAAAIDGGAGALAVFSGPHAYISPSWYVEPQRNVPTWNYVAVHAGGRLRQAPDPRAIVAQLSAFFESRFEQPWAIDRLSPDYVASQLRGIRAFEMRIDTLSCAAKLAQNHDDDDLAGVIAALAASLEPNDRATADLMRRPSE